MNFPQGEPGLPVRIIDKGSLCLYLIPQAFPSYFLEGSDRAAGWVAGSWSRLPLSIYVYNAFKKLSIIKLCEKQLLHAYW